MVQLTDAANAKAIGTRAWSDSTWKFFFEKKVIFEIEY